MPFAELVLAAGQFRAEGGLLVKDVVPVAPADDQLGAVRRGQVLGHGTGGEAVAAGQGVRGRRLGKRFQQRRIAEHVQPYEDTRLRELTGEGTQLARVLILERDFRPGRTTIILVREPIGV